jgi:uncharacterized membrane protein
VRAPRFLLRAVLIVLASAEVGCTTATETSGGAACVHGEVIDCTDDGGYSGRQQCLPDLTAYGPCMHDHDAGATDAGPKDGG